MKKSIFIFFIILIIILALWGLTTKYFPKTKNTQSIPSSINGITLSLNNNQTHLNKPVLEINIKNSNNYEVTYGSEWTIERYVNKEWKRVFPIDEKSFTVQLFAVEPHSSSIETINLQSYLEDELIVGKYRIIKEIENKQIKYLLGITFEIK
ncbi:hypothetical protein PZE06_04830 [Robertmurraya sp. DFI.2.37]|jgi:hypothetical protein|uniref:immunoglobulin-like domain-containing protein n=1 Tax=Robertmurraya sp. DFI.2.37 TaxID=3031819 RepID=UPI001247B7AC|nr:immunoglobulin-like domain-containing protein [Robertmurraya sp. DFI.2.37]MDF1507507.1 hypothetical protein [Robertmurraya sp. DFI.2.37]